MTRRLASFIVALLLALATAIPVLAQDAPPRGIPRDAEPATVRSVVDGDTIRVTLADGSKDTVRLIGIDTPETKAPGEPVGCYGPEASTRLEKLLPTGREVWLEADETNRDRFDRLLRYVWVEKKDGDRYLANEVMVRDGFALAKRYRPDTERAERLEAAQARAIDAGRGLWSACPEFVRSLTPVPTAAPVPTQAPVVPEPTAVPPAPIATGCDPNYAGACVWVYPPDVDCQQIPAKNIQVTGYDPHGLDGDHDGIGCES